MTTPTEPVRKTRPDDKTFGTRRTAADREHLTGAPDLSESAWANAHHGETRKRSLVGRTGIFAILIAVGALTLSGAVGFVLRLGVGAELNSTLMVSLTVVLAVLFVGVLFAGGRNEHGERPVAGAAFLAGLGTLVLLIGLLYAWAVS